MPAEDAAQRVGLVDHDVAQSPQERRPLRVAWEEADVQHVGVGADHVGVPTYPRSLDVGAVTVVRRGDHSGELEGVEGAQLVVTQRLGRVEQQRRGGSGPCAGCTDGGLRHERLARGRPRREHGRRAVQHELQGIGLVGPERVHPEPFPNLVGELWRAGFANRAARAGSSRAWTRSSTSSAPPADAPARSTSCARMLLDDRVEGCGGVRHGIVDGSGAGTGTVRTSLRSLQSRLQRFTKAAPERSRWTSDSM